MRLPTVTNGQRQVEAARAIHEQLWEAYDDERPIFIPGQSPETVGHELVMLSGNLHSFWHRRGFRVRCRVTSDKAGIWSWLEPKPVRGEPSV